MGYEIRLDDFKIISKSVLNQTVVIRSDNGEEFTVSAKGLPYCLSDIDENIYLGVNYGVKENKVILDRYKEVLERMKFDYDNIRVTVKYIVHELSLFIELRYYDKRTGKRLALKEMNKLYMDLKEGDSDRECLSNDFLVGLTFLEANIDILSYDSRENFVGFLDDECIKYNEEYVKDDLMFGDISKTYLPGEYILYDFNDDNDLIFKVSNREIDIVKSKEKSKLNKLKDGFYDKLKDRLEILKRYPSLDGFKFYHVEGKLLIGLYEGDNLLLETPDLNFSLVHAVLDFNIEK